MRLQAGKRACDVTMDHSFAVLHGESQAVWLTVWSKMAGYGKSLIRDRGEVESGFLGSLVDVEVVRAGSVKSEEEIGKQLIVIRRRTFTIRRLTEALSRNVNALENAD
jgi:hypothetical protein